MEITIRFVVTPLFLFKELSVMCLLIHRCLRRYLIIWGYLKVLLTFLCVLDRKSLLFPFEDSKKVFIEWIKLLFNKQRLTYSKLSVLCELALSVTKIFKNSHFIIHVIYCFINHSTFQENFFSFWVDLPCSLNRSYFMFKHEMMNLTIDLFDL